MTTPKLTIPTHPNIDLVALQAVADGIMPGVKLSIVVTSEPIREPDMRVGYAGKNKLAIKTPCAACNETSEVVDAEGYPATCTACHLGQVHTDPRMDVQHVVVDLGHKTRVEIGHLSHPPGVHKSRKDLFVPRTHAELVAEVRRAIGCIAWEVAKAEGGEPGLAHERAMQLLDVAESTRAIDHEKVFEHRVKRVAAHARGVAPEHAASHPTRPEREVFYYRECATCTRAVSALTLAQLDEQMEVLHGVCSAPAHTDRITRVHSLDASGKHVQTDTAEVVP
jgi:cytochrome c5